MKRRLNEMASERLAGAASDVPSATTSSCASCRVSLAVIVFVALPSGKRYAFVGDLVWQLEGITLREERPWLMRRMVDVDHMTLQRSLLRMVAVHERYPEITIVPARLPRWSPWSPAMGRRRSSSWLG